MILLYRLITKDAKVVYYLENMIFTNFNRIFFHIKRTIKRITDNAVHPNGETVFKEYTQVERIEHNRYRLLVKTSITVIGLACLLNRAIKLNDTM
jgi:hypothetical protein